MGRGRWQLSSANRNHREPKGQQPEPEKQHKPSEPCALRGARTVHQGGKRREAPTYPNWYSHAGAQPGVPFWQTPPEVLLWGKDEFLTAEDDWGKPVVCGHYEVA